MVSFFLCVIFWNIRGGMSEDGSRQVVRGVSVVVKDRDGKEDPQDLYADAVILSAGGWGADSDTEDSLLKEFRPDLAVCLHFLDSFSDSLHVFYWARLLRICLLFL